MASRLLLNDAMEEDDFSHVEKYHEPESFYQASIRRLISHVLSRAGYSDASQLAMVCIEEQLMLRMGSLYHVAKGYATLSRRTRPVATDFILALEHVGTSVSDIQRIYKQNKLYRVGDMTVLHQPPIVTTKTESYLSSLEAYQSKEDIGASEFFPALPPPHTYRLDTDAKNKNDDPSSILNERIRTSRLIEKSLQNLLANTDGVSSSSPRQRQQIQGQRQQPDTSNTNLVLHKQEPPNPSSFLLLPSPKDTQINRDLAVVNFQRQWFKKPVIMFLPSTTTASADQQQQQQQQQEQQRQQNQQQQESNSNGPSGGPTGGSGGAVEESRNVMMTDFASADPKDLYLLHQKKRVKRWRLV